MRVRVGVRVRVRVRARVGVRDRFRVRVGVRVRGIGSGLLYPPRPLVGGEELAEAHRAIPVLAVRVRVRLS